MMRSFTQFYKQNKINKKVLLYNFLFWCLITPTLIVSQVVTEDLSNIIEISNDSIIEKLTLETVEQSEVIYPNFKAPNYNSDTETYLIENVPSPRGNGIMGYVSDPNDFIDASSELRINQLLFELEQKSSVEVAVVVLPSIGEDIPKQFAIQLFELWGIGKAETDNGLLILTVMDQRRTEFEVGYGLEPILTDAICFRIGVNEIVPNFKVGNYGKGLVNSVIKVNEFIDNPTVIDEVYSTGVVYPKNNQWQVYHYILACYFILCFFFAFKYYGILYQIELSKDDFYDKANRLAELKLGCLAVFFPIPLIFLSALIKKRLHKYRTAPRYSKVNGKLMTLKNEWTENDFLEAAQILEEELKSKRYDVWVTDDQSDVLILEYKGRNSRKYSNCKKCKYKTYGKKSSKITKYATYQSTGERIDYYECRNCNYSVKDKVTLPIKVRSTSSSSGSSSSYSSSSSSSSSFGGGSSGGGGAGVSW